MNNKMQKAFATFFIVCLVLLFAGMCSGLAGVWIEGYAGSDLCRKLSQTNWILFGSSVVAAGIAAVGISVTKGKTDDYLE